jgi:hypothetical protein
MFSIPHFAEVLLRNITIPVCIITEMKCWYKIQEHNEVPVRYTGIYRPISSTGTSEKLQENSKYFSF